jgi:hypothetical protein
MKHDQQENWRQNASLGENDGPRAPGLLGGYNRPPGYILCLLEMYAIPDASWQYSSLRPALQADGLVRENCTTEKGRAYIEMLCNTPLPVMLWADPREAK